MPAGPGLFDLYDRRLLHFRRYGMRDLRRMATRWDSMSWKARTSGFSVPGVLDRQEEKSIPEDASAAVKDRDGRDMRRLGHSPVLTWLMRWEEPLRPRVPYPVGIRCLLTCRSRKNGRFSRVTDAHNYGAFPAGAAFAGGALFCSLAGIGRRVVRGGLPAALALYAYRSEPGNQSSLTASDRAPGHQMEGYRGGHAAALCIRGPGDAAVPVELVEAGGAGFHAPRQ